MLKVQDSFNEKNLNNNNINKKTKLNMSFTGHKVIQDDNGENSYRFYLPTLALKEGSNVELELARFEKDENGNYKYLEPLDHIEREKRNNYFDCSFYSLNLDDKKDKELNEKNKDYVIAYRFKINNSGKESTTYLDSTLLTPDRQWNIATPPSRPVLEEARSMYHIMPDLMISKKTEKENPAIYDARRTHFNKLGGNIDGIIEKIDYMKDLGAKRILSTPIFGQDNLSSHGYWTTNPYQITDCLGDISKFKKLNTELFKRGMGWIADGAFVNEGLEGIHTEHISKWGTQSPYIDWLNTFSFPDKPFKFGILSKKDTLDKKGNVIKKADVDDNDNIINKNLGIRLINADKKLHVDEKTGKEMWVENKVDSKKPTYVQIYDKRLAAAKQVNSDEIIRSYDNKNSEDPNKINDYMDSVIPYKFQIKPEEVSDKFKNWKEAEKLTAEKGLEKPPFRNFLAEWTNFAATSSDSDGGTTLWVGNKDISKLRFMLTEQDKKDITFKYGKDAEDKIKKVETSINQVQDNIVQVGEFWTNEVAKTLHAHTAKELSGATDAKGYAKLIDEKVKAGKLPQAALKIVKQNKDGSFESSAIKNLLKGGNNYNLKTAPVPQNVTDGLMSYPFDAIEFNSGMSGILGSPFLKKLAFKEDQIGKSRYEIYDGQKDKADYKDLLPEKLKNDIGLNNTISVYKKMDNVIAGQMTKAAVEILKEVDEKRPEDKKILKDGNLTKDGKELYSLISNDVAKFIVTQGLLTEANTYSADLFKGEKLSPKENTENLEYDNKLLNKVSPQSLGINANTPAGEADTLITRLESGIKNINPEEKKAFAKHLAGRLEGLDGNAVKVAKLVVDKAEGGLEWRIDASKDVCPVEEILEGKADFESSWDKGVKFWEKFTSGVRKFNPRAYEILEVTDEGDLVKKGNYDCSKDADGKDVYTLKSEDLKYKDMQEASMKFIQGAGATTPTNYNFFYSLPQKLFGSFTEEADHGNCGISEVIKNILCAWADPGKDYSTLGHLHAGSLDTANQAHNSIGNHDKPRAMHLFGLDTDTFFNEGKGKAMGDALKDSFAKAYESKSIPEFVQKDIEKAIANLSTGKYHVKEDGQLVEKEIDSEYFGVRPFDINIKDVLKEAKLISKKTLKYLDSNSEAVKKLEKDTLMQMFDPALKKYRASIGLLVAVNGNPTVYAGDELGETGFENKYKNTFVQNRNFNHYNRAEKYNPDYIKEIETQKNEIAKLMNLRKQEALSPLVNGSTVVLDTKNPDVVGLYRYNDEKDMFILLNNKGFGPSRAQAGLKDGESVSVDYIDLSHETMLNYEEGKGTKVEQGLLTNLEAGATYKNALKNDNITYEISEKDGKKVLKRTDGEAITMLGTDLFLYREKNFDGNKNEISSSKNPHVMLSNLKYGIPAAKKSNFVKLNKDENKTKAFV